MFCHANIPLGQIEAKGWGMKRMQELSFEKKRIIFIKIVKTMKEKLL